MLSLQIVFIAGLLCFMALLIAMIRRNSFSLKDTLIWLLSASAMLIVSIFPGISEKVAKLLGFETPSNAIFSLLLGFVTVILLSLSAAVSKSTMKIKTLTQKIALLERELRLLKMRESHAASCDKQLTKTSGDDEKGE